MDRLGVKGVAREVRSRAIRSASGPLTRTTPIPPRPGGVAIATIVSDVENSYFTEIITVFSNASPMLSDVTVPSSAIARWTMRRS